MSMPSVFVKVTVGAAALPLEVVSTFKGSDLTIGVIDVPKNRFGLEVTGVNVRVENALEAAINVAAVRKGNVYVATFPASHFALSGSVSNGVTVTLTGVDEKGIERSWVAGKGDLSIIDSDGSVMPGEDYKTLRWYASAPVNPQPGDVAPIEGVAKVWSGSAWVDFAGGGSSGSGAVVLRVDGGKVYKGDKEVALFSDLLAMVQGGGVTLLNTVGGNPKDALYYPHYCDETGIRFDATGLLGSAVQTRSIVMQPKSGGGITVTPGSLVEIAKKTDLTALSNKLGDKIDIKAGGSEAQFSSVVVAKNFHESAIDNQAIITGFTLPSRFVSDGSRELYVNSIRVRGAVSDSGVWDRSAKLAKTRGGSYVASGLTTMAVGNFATYAFDDVVSVDSGAFVFVKENGAPANVRVGLVAVDPSEGYSVSLANGNTVYNYAPVIEFVGIVNRQFFIDTAVTRASRLSAVKSVSAAASQAEIIAKLNELIGLYK